MRRGVWRERLEEEGWLTVIMRESNGCLPGSVIRGSSVPFCFRYFYIKVSTSKRQNSWSWRVKVEETTCMLIVENSLPFTERLLLDYKQY